MATLTQTQDAYMVINGWYGKCHDDQGTLVEVENCPDFDLTQSSVADKIRAVYWTKSDNTIQSFNSGAESSLQDFTKLECGAAYLIYLQKGTADVVIPHFVASHSNNSLQGRITDECEAGGGSSDFDLDAVSSFSDELDEGYINGDATDYDAEEHSNVIISAEGVASITISADKTNKLEYSTGGAWQTITPADSTISSDFTSLKLRVKVGLENGPDHNTTVSLVATPENNLYQNQPKSIAYNITVNNVALSASKTINEVIEEGNLGNIGGHHFDIAYENLESLSINTGDPHWKISLSGGSGYVTSMILDEYNVLQSSGSLTIYVKMASQMPSTTVQSQFTITGERRTSGADIVLTNTVIATATVAPRPQITALSVNPTYSDGHLNTIPVSVAFSDKNNYGGDHWHYKVENSGGEVAVDNQEVAFGGTLTLNNDDFDAAGDYVLTAWITNPGHQAISGSSEKTANFTIAADNAVLSLNKTGITEILDIDEAQATHSVNITWNNVSNLDFSPDSLTNWEYVSSTTNSFSVKLKDSVKGTDLSSGFVDLPQETVTLTADVGPRDTSGDAQKTVQVTLDAKLVDDAEFSVTPPAGQSLTVTDNRNYEVSAQEFGPFTVAFDAVTLSSNSVSHWEVQVNGTGSWTGTGDFGSLSSGDTFKIRNSKTLPGSYNETLTITPSAAASDHDSSDDPSAISLTLNCTINALVATLTNPGTQTLSSITSGESPSNKTFQVYGDNIQNVTITEVSSGWSVVASPVGPDVFVAINFTGDAVSVGTKTGSFKISAEATVGSNLATTFHVVNLSFTVNAKTSSISTNPSSITLNPITSGGSSNVAYMNVAGSNVDNIVLTTIPAGFVVRNGATTLSNGASGLDGEQLTISLADTTTPGTRNGTIVLTGTASANSAFSGGVNTKNVSVSGVVQGLATALSISPSSVTDNVDENGSVSAHQITLTQSNLETVSVSGGNASKYQVSSSENGSYGNSISPDNTASSFWVKLMDTSSSGTISTDFTISGTKDYSGASNPSNVTLSCTATVNAIDATLTVDPTSVTDTVDKDGSVSAHPITVTYSNLDDMSVSGGNSSKYMIAKSESGTYKTSISYSSSSFRSGTSATFWVKLMDTSATGSISTTVTVSGDHISGGADPSDQTVTCTATVNEVDTGGADDCTACRGSSVVFDHSVDTIGLGVEATGHGASGVTITGGEMTGVGGLLAGSLCFFGISGTTNAKTMTTDMFMLSDGTMVSFQFDMNNTIIDGRVVYRASDGTFWGGTMSASGGNFTMTEINDCIGGGDTPTGCATCSSVAYDHSVDTIGLGVEATGHGASGVTITGGEMTGVGGLLAGSLCFFGISGTTNAKTMTTDMFMLSDGTMVSFQFDMNNTIIDGRIGYLASDETCWQGTMSASGGNFTMTQI